MEKHMARGTFFEVAKEAENLGNMDETQFYGSYGDCTLA